MPRACKNIPVKVVPEEGYSFDDYRDIIRLECERMERIVRTHDYISEGDRFLVPATEKAVPSLEPALRQSDTRVNYFKRYGANSSFYGVPVRPNHTRAKTSGPPPAFALAEWPYLSEEDRTLKSRLEGYDKVICLSDRFWSNYHHILNTHADQTTNVRYGWEPQIAAIPLDLATKAFRHTAYTFQSWLYYRATCETGKILIIATPEQMAWIAEHHDDLLPSCTDILIAGAELKLRPFMDNNTALLTTRDGLSACLAPASRLCATNELHADQQSLPKISVVVCSYNQADYLELCLQSILDQKYPNLELIVVDGNSTDHSKDILERYRGQCTHLLIEDDDGQSDALNKGFSLSSGDVMTWVCSDDGLEPDALMRVGLAFAAQPETDVLVGGCRRIDAEGNNLSIHHTHLPYRQQVRLSFGDMISFGPTWLRSFYFIQPELFWSRRIWEKSGGYIANHMFFAMDYELFLRFALAGARAYHIPQCLAFALVHQAQKSAHAGRNLPTILRMMREFETLFAELTEEPGH